MQEPDHLDLRTSHPATRRGGRVFGHGGLRLVLLRLIADQPRHGYQLIKAIEERLGGSYSPSPGVIYPTLTLLEELGHVTVSVCEGGRKLHTVTANGLEHLQTHRAEVDELLARMDSGAALGSGRQPRPAPVERAVTHLRQALQLRLAREPLGDAQAHAIAELLDTAARQIERL